MHFSFELMLISFAIVAFLAAGTAATESGAANVGFTPFNLKSNYFDTQRDDGSLLAHFVYDAGSSSPPLGSVGSHELFGRQAQSGALSNLQFFTGSLGGIKAPAIIQSSDQQRPFSVGGDTFPDFATAASRACSIQNNECCDKANAAGAANGQGMQENTGQTGNPSSSPPTSAQAPSQPASRAPVPASSRSATASSSQGAPSAPVPASSPHAASSVAPAASGPAAASQSSMNQQGGPNQQGQLTPKSGGNQNPAAGGTAPTTSVAAVTSSSAAARNGGASAASSSVAPTSSSHSMSSRVSSATMASTASAGAQQQGQQGGASGKGAKRGGGAMENGNNMKDKRQATALSVNNCNAQMSQCNAVVRAAPFQTFNLVNIGPDPNDPTFDLLCSP